MRAVGSPRLTPDQGRALRALIDKTASDPPPDLADRIRERLRVDLSTEFAGRTVRHPFGKASGQLSCTPAQVQEDVASGIAFIVLKTVVAEGADAERSMAEWARRETRMRVERRMSRRGQEGWTVTWKGRGWSGTLADYLEFCRAAWTTASASDVPVLPSVTYQLPRDGAYRLEEYRHTTRALVREWERVGSGPLWLEKDFSPTLAGDSLADDRDRIIGWIREVPGLIASSAERAVRVGMKLMNARFDDVFQLAMLEAVAGTEPRPDYLVVFNRLYDAVREVAYGGWDLSDRNLAVLRAAQDGGMRLPRLSATGNIGSGRLMADYALAGCHTGQVHTFFQLPKTEYLATGGARTARALHTLMLHPSHGLVPWLWHLAAAGIIEPVDGRVRFCDAVGRGGST